MRKILTGILFCSVILCAALPAGFVSAEPSAVTYYVSSSSGSDSNNGLSDLNSFATITKVNSLNLAPGDRVLFKCGDIWRADPLVLAHSGTAAAQITFSSYPAGCADRPTLSGSRPVGGWVADGGNIYHADLSSSVFPHGLNQLFRGGLRLTMGRWPNIDAPDAGYAFVDAHTTDGNQITDAALPAVDWTGAIVHIKNIRWSMLDRLVTSSSGHTLTLNAGLSCLISGWGSCVNWGYFINNSIKTLDEDGEWFYDSSANRVYLYSTSGTPAQIEGSVVLATGDSVRTGGINLSDGSATAYVTIDNLAVQNWFNDGIGTPGGMNGDIYHDLTIRNVTVKDVDAAGINLSSWLQNPSNGRQNLRGGYNLLFESNLVDGANDFGVTGYFASSTFKGNTIQNIALIKNLNAGGMGCGITTGECTENGDGFRIRAHNVLDSGYGNVLKNNVFDKIGYNGIDVFGPETTLQNNLIQHTCYTKADCGGVRTFGGDSLADTPVYDLRLIGNVITDITGNVDGCPASLHAFGMGLYIDHYSRNVEARGNTVANTTISGILYQQSTGQVIDNIVFNASSGTEYSAQIDVSGDASSVSLQNNVMYALKSNAWTLYVSGLGNLTASDDNYFFHPYVDKQIAYGGSWTRATFAQWKALSGKDVHSIPNWFTQPSGESSRGRIFYNASALSQTVDLGSRQYLTLDQHAVAGSILLAPYTSIVLVDNGPASLTLQSITPSLISVTNPVDFTLHLRGSGFTASSVVRWNGSPRPTAFISGSQLSAAIFASDVSALGDYAVTVWDPTAGSSGTETPALILYVVDHVYILSMPMIAR